MIGSPLAPRPSSAPLVRRLGLIALALALAAGAGACGARWTVSHNVPAPPKVVRVAAPGPDHVWVEGHYTWRGSRYVWVEGRWVAPRKGKRWQAGAYRWERRGGARVRVWVPGRWVAVGGSTVTVTPRPRPRPKPQPTVTVTVRELPPPPKSRRAPQPGPKYVWVDGHYRWQGGRYVWQAGRWVMKKPGKRWQPGRYEVRRQGQVKVKVWIPGQWVAGGGGGGGTVTVKPARKPKVVVHELPKPPKARRPPQPSPKYVWVGGHYRWQGGRYIWKPGKWVMKKPGKRWTKGRYEWRVQGSVKVKVWTPGSWR